jgi:putative heme-binding domain-containing protein
MPDVLSSIFNRFVRFTRSFYFVVPLFLGLAAASAQTPEWIWHGNNGKPPGDNEFRSFKTTVTIDQPVAKAKLAATADDDFQLFINGKRVLRGNTWNHTFDKDVTANLVQGENLILATAHNEGSAAGFIARLEITFRNGDKKVIVTDSSWLASEQNNPKAGTWVKSVSLGQVGVQPWGDIFKSAEATPVSALKVLPGFKVELLRSAQPAEGSWVSMTVDDQGRLIVSPQDGNLLRMTVPTGEGEVKVEEITTEFGSAMGLLWAKGYLFVDGRGPEGLGIYRLQDPRGNGQYTVKKLLKKIPSGGGEHGSHGIVLGPDGYLYQVNGNFVQVLRDIAKDSPHKNYADDLILPRLEDGNGFGVGNKPPGGHILRFDTDGQKFEIFAAGQRNDYDIAFNEDGELFGFDSDMEWDWGLPWYRPIRINHIVSGADFGFREGSGKWPVWYPDSLPPSMNIGVGSPTGVKFGTGSKFPAKYRKAFFAMDWTYGRIFAVHLTPEGATYSATAEDFIRPRGAPLNVTDLEIGKDGAMYFITGGRGTQSGLYRVTYTGPQAAETAPSASELDDLKAASEARALRHRIEAFQTKKDPSAIDFIWGNLKSPDRWIRYAARIALENQDVSLWQDRVFQEEQTDALITATLALARVGEHSLEKRLFGNLAKLSGDSLTEAQGLESLRTVEVIFARMGRPDAETAAAGIEALSKYYPAEREPLNRELCQLLVYLEAPDVVEKTLGLLDAATTQEEQIFYITALRNLKKGWTKQQHEHYFAWFHKSRAGLDHTDDTLQWFKDAGRDYGDGASFGGFLKNIHRDAVAALSDNERGELAAVIIGKKVEAKAAVVQPRKFVKDWKMPELVASLDLADKGRSFARGKEVFTAAQCIVCHRFGNEGGAVGPDITAVFSRFTRRDVLESIIDPSKVIAEQYQASVLSLKNGEEITGRLVEETQDAYQVLVNPLTQDRTKVNKADVTGKRPSKTSPMPEGLLNTFTKEEIMDLLAYIQSAGKPDAPIYSAGSAK